VQELKGERIDIVVWSPDIAVYAQNALSPAIISRIMVDDEEKTLEVVVPDDQLTLAIGRKGQNVKLAAHLLGWKIDIFTESRYGELNADKKGMDQLASVAEVPMETIIAAGFETTAQLVGASEEQLLTIPGMTPERIRDMRAAINILGLAPAVESEAQIIGEAGGEADGGEGPEA